MALFGILPDGGAPFTSLPQGQVAPTQMYMDPATGSIYTQMANGQWSVRPKGDTGGGAQIMTGNPNDPNDPSTRPPPSAVKMQVGADGYSLEPVVNPNTGQPSVMGAPGTLGYGFGTSPEGIISGINQTTAQDKALVGNAVTQGQANLAAAAGATGQAGSTILGNAYNQQGFQAGQGAQGLQQGQKLADYNTALGQNAMSGMAALGGQANDASGFYGQQGVNAIANAGQDRASQLQAISNLRGFYQNGPGPSAAEAQLRMANDQTQANALSLANSGRGAGDAAQAQRQAMFANAATQQTTNMQMAQLRAEEEAKWRQTQLQGMGLEQGTLGNLQGADINAGNAAGSLGANYADIAKGYYQGGVGAQQGYAGQANAALGTGQGYNANMTTAGNTAAGQGISAYDSLSGQANDLTKTGTGVGLQGAGLQTGLDQSAEQSKQNVYQGALGNETQRYGIDKGVAIQQQGIDNQKTGALISGAATLGAGLLMASDIRGKTDIVPVINHFRAKAIDPLARMRSIASLTKAS